MKTDVNEAVRAIIAETFDIPANVVTDETVADDIDGWDSLSHTVLMIRLQNAFGIRIPEAVAAEAATVGELTAAVAEIAGARV
ncbi:acyl carrier protein [uncultured Methylobacterium sp.]|uniref:acyl carrier protein n=1 Tax=uncultured Methylobacterium sp. TaxID=157278 RepID=UPI002599C9C9|nr:acyl carrier protein [uncultured Methylobacterium sp.]